ncbi:MAG: tetratricopeptide repeat protein [Candidatus Eisenbacteria bacterium]|uniref:Tetratricopeptide repeat protein n=1 Tax=Eiseniibacteriota bacterium TaxID=2212470 RepID=A0A849SUF2_UNCEI|nr:tetratricopeptide repeat protein [Candidatus Eisenbacteria bacterium]
MKTPLSSSRWMLTCLIAGALATSALAPMARADDVKDGKAALAANRLDDAMQSFERAASQGLAAGRAGAGRVYLRRRQLDKALDAFQIAQKMDAGLAEAHWGQGEVLKRLDKCAEAVPFLEKAVDLDRKFPEAQLSLGECLIAIKQLDRASEAYSVGLKWGPRWTPRFLVGLGGVETARDSLRAAAIYFTRAREQAPSDPDVRRALGDFYFGRGTWALAALEYQAAVEIDSSDAELHYGLGQALFYDKRYNEALDEYRIAVRQSPEFAAGQLALGNILYLSGAADPRRYAEARVPLEAYVKLAPDDPRGLSALGRTLYYLRERDAAIEMMTKASQLGEKSKDMYTVLGRAFADKREWQKAIEAFERGEPGPKEALIVAQILSFTGQPLRADSVYQAIIARDSTSGDARFALNELGKMKFAAKDWSGALGLFQRRIALDPRNGEAYYYSGLSYKQMDQLGEAINALRQAAALDSARADRHFWLGVLLDQQKDVPGATVAFARAVALDSTSKLMGKAYAQLGYYALLDKNWEGAAGQLERAAALDPQDKQSLVWLGQAYQNSGNRSKALETYRRVLAIDPAQPDALRGVKAVSGGAPSPSKGGGQ